MRAFKTNALYFSLQFHQLLFINKVLVISKNTNKLHLSE